MATLLHNHRPLAAAAATVALVLVTILSPDASRVAAVSILGALHTPGDVPFVAAHRGGADGAPENTLPAFRLALASTAEFVETDLQLTSDGVPVLMHDFTLDRTTNGSGPVWANSWDTVSHLDAGSWFDPAFAGTGVPRLDDLLELVRPTTKRILLEVKGSWTEDQLTPVVASIRANDMEGRVVVASFDLTSLVAARAVGPDLQRVLIIRSVEGDPAALAASCGASAIVTSKAFLRADPGVVARIHNAGLGVMIYTLNSGTTWADAVDLGVDGIITDKPRELDVWLAKNG
ncbi:MAG: hypothetical protein KF761_00605 [Salinibacterium sp.]|nr:hypothetical protein [Salinibacterium sp.]